MSAHTPEPWEHKITPDGDHVIVNEQILQGVGKIFAGDNANRIVACVNACKDSTTEELEQVANAGGFALLIARWNLEASAHADNADSFADEIDRLEKQRDELLSALRRISNRENTFLTKECMHRIADCAIAKLGEV